MFDDAVIKLRYDNKNHVVPAEVPEFIDEIPAFAGMTKMRGRQAFLTKSFVVLANR